MAWIGFEKEAPTVGIVGLGYVGLPMALQFARQGCRVIGLDIDARKTAAINAGRSYIKTIASDAIAESVGTGRLAATTDFSRVAEADAILICVPTPLTAHREPDISYITKTGAAIAPHLKPGQLVSLESTTYPGTTEEDLIPILERGSGLRAGEDLHIVFSPEREDPGNPHFGTRDIPKVIGGLTPACLEAGLKLYGFAVKSLVPVSSPGVAEATKLVENIFRSVNIAMVNELKIVFDAMGIDIWEVLDAAKTKPFGFMKFEPGPGLGGHCLVGEETVRVRDGQMDTVIPLKDLFAHVEQHGQAEKTETADVAIPENLEVLSINMSDGQVGWEKVSVLCKRWYRGPMTTIKIAGNRTLRTTNLHPFLVVENDRLAVRQAEQIKPGDFVPVDSESFPTNPLSQSDAVYPHTWQRGKMLPVEEVITEKGEAFVYSLEVPKTHTFLASQGIFVHNCIPIDPFYLTWKAREYGIQTKFIELAGEVNTAMPKYVVSRLMESLSDAGKPLRAAKILLLGLAYKKNVDDPRESPTFAIWDLLRVRGADVTYHDPYIAVAPFMREHPDYEGIASVALDAPTLADADAVVICTAHDEVDYEFVVRHSSLVIDTRNACANVAEELKRGKVVKA